MQSKPVSTQRMSMLILRLVMRKGVANPALVS